MHLDSQNLVFFKVGRLTFMVANVRIKHVLMFAVTMKKVVGVVMTTWVAWLVIFALRIQVQIHAEILRF